MHLWHTSVAHTHLTSNIQGRTYSQKLRRESPLLSAPNYSILPEKGFVVSKTQNDLWYLPSKPEEIASPALLIFVDRVERNIQSAIKIAGGVKRLRPHIKTHKLSQIVAMHQAHGLTKVKCATLAEAEMAAQCGVPDVLLAYQPVGPNQPLLLDLVRRYPETQFGCLTDNGQTAHQLASKTAGADIKLNVWIDIDNGGRRTGIRPGPKTEELARLITGSSHLIFAGIHVYDGQFSRLAIQDRIEQAKAAFAPVQELTDRMRKGGIDVPNIVAGGTPTFPVHASNPDLDLSPGTYSLWDMGYATHLPDLPFIPAAMLLTRVVSNPEPDLLCVDLGSKAVAAENPLQNRVRFLNAPDADFISQSEEHLVIKVPDEPGFMVGDILYGIPWHICPTVALYQEALAIDGNGLVSARWPITARNRRL